MVNTRYLCMGKNLIFCLFSEENPNRKYVEFQSKLLLLSICVAKSALLSPLPVIYKNYINKRQYFHEICYIIYGSNKLKTHSKVTSFLWSSKHIWQETLK